MLPTGVDVILNENAKSLVRRQTHLKSATIATDSLQRTEPSEMLVELVDLSLNIETLITEDVLSSLLILFSALDMLLFYIVQPMRLPPT